MALMTRCAHCQTVFRVTPEQLQAHGGQVRCGRCQQVFDARAALLPETPPAAAAEPMVSTADVSAVNTGLVEAVPPTVPLPQPVMEAADEPVDAAPEPAAVPAETVVAEPDSLPPVESPGLTGPESSSAMPEDPVEAAAEPAVVADPANPFIQKPEPGSIQRPRSRLLAAACLLLGLLIAGQAVFFYRGELAARHPLLRQWLNAACAPAGCVVPLPQSPKFILIEGSDLQLLDPANPNRIQLTATLRNHAGHAVGYPALDLVLTNANDHTLARRIFLPAEYLDRDRDPRTGMAANAELTVRLALETANLGAAGFRLAVLPAPQR